MPLNQLAPLVVTWLHLHALFTTSIDCQGPEISLICLQTNRTLKNQA